MEAGQYEWAFQRRRPYEVRPLFAGREVAGLLRSAARQAKLLGAASEAWERTAPRCAEGATRVMGFAEGRLLIAVADAPTAHHLRQEAGRLKSQLGSLLPGLRELRFAVMGREFGAGQEKTGPAG